MFDSSKFNEWVVRNKVIGFFEKPIVLKSGRTSHFYVNWRTVLSDVFLADELTDFLVDYLVQNNLNPDCIYGVPEGATKTGLLATYKWAKRSSTFSKGSHAFAMGRAKPKEHGDPKDRYFVGTPIGKTLVLEDVTTTGGSLLDEVKRLQNHGIEIMGLLSLTSRCEKRDDGKTVGEAIAQSFGKIPYHVLSKATDLLPQVDRQHKIPNEIRMALSEEFEEYGEASLRW